MSGNRGPNGARKGAIRLVLGDQLTLSGAHLRDIRRDIDCVLMAEVRAEATYVRHHKQKIALIFAAMRAFAAQLRSQNTPICYVRIDDPANSHSLEGEIARLIGANPGRFDRLIALQCGEYRLDQAMQNWSARFQMPVEIREDDRFIASRAAFSTWATGRKALRMEYFYREMRRKTGLLMDGEAPIGGAWNYDSDNRKAIPATIPAPFAWLPRADNGRNDAILDVKKAFSAHFGALDALNFPVDRTEALDALTHFLDWRLPCFGDYQDGMRRGEPFLWHSILSTSLNLGLLTPLEVCAAAQQRYFDGKAPLNAVEGFIRQILGWREYVRGLYWHFMPQYKEINALDAQRRLPDFYWTAKTDMACIADCVETTRQYAYAHHIQRLMVTGNFALLAGISPAEINEWYMIVYADAFEWVELPNTHGMAIYADGGIMASKPYAASGKYINRMSDYCQSCKYSPDLRAGEGACPFNFLYWNFLLTNQARFARNPRMSLALKSLDRLSTAEVAAIRRQAEAFLDACAPLPNKASEAQEIA